MGTTARCVLLLAVTVALAACSSSGKKGDDVEPNIFPANYKNEIALTLSKTLDDPTNIREAAISEPALRPVASDQRYAVCLRYNARDWGGRYTGAKDSVAYFFGGHLNQLVDATPEQCGKAAYKPYPELEKLCQAVKCN